MVKINHRIAWYVLCTVSLIEGRVGCMARERPVYKYDNKTYHYIRCDCPCTAMATEDRNRCLDCGHYHDVRPWIIVDPAERQVMAERAEQPERSPRFDDPVDALKHLIAKEQAARGKNRG